MPDFILRPAELRDMKPVFDLANDPLVRENSIHTDPIPWKDHVVWFNSIVVDPDVKLFIAETATGEMVGQVRFQKRGAAWIVSISVAAAFRGKKIGGRLLDQAIKDCRGLNMIAQIRKTNTASIKMFAAAGFIEDTATVSSPHFLTMTKESHV